MLCWGSLENGIWEVSVLFLQLLINQTMLKFKNPFKIAVSKKLTLD